ncbi:unnamed protein product [Caenorhabditis brenneri]
MVDRTFPLLLLPYLALCNLLDYFSLNELIRFSFCSERTQRIASRKPKGEVEIILKAKTQPEFIVRLNNNETHKFDILGNRALLSTPTAKPTPIAGTIVPTRTILSYTATFWTDAVQGIDRVGTYLTELLKTPVTELRIVSEKKENDMISIIDSVKSRQNSVGKCFFGQNDHTNRSLTHLLSNLEITDDFNLDAMPSYYFRFVWSLKYVTLTVSFGRWLTVEHLMNMNCQYVDIQRTNIGSEDLNQFLKHWQNGGCSSLKFLQLSVSPSMLANIIEGIEAEQIPDTTSRLYTGHNGEPIRKSGGHDIKRRDGTIGTVFFTPQSSFQFAVQL